MKKETRLLSTFFLAFSTLVITHKSHAKEGIWIPATLFKQESAMKELGLEIPISKIYNDSGTGLNNAVVLFGRGCTGEIISSKGLVLTNHHCGYGTVQGLGNLKRDYFATGFFAKNNAEEVPCPGLTITFIRRIENVTAKVLPGIADTLRDAERDSVISKRIAGLEREYEIKTGMEASIKPYFEGNQYWVAIAETYRDIRLVGFPPNGIGTFGGDDENWAWPRHTGDFSVFRVYADSNNKPANYDASNKPFNTDQYFTINSGGFKEGDFAMVYGFPGTTNEYVSSFELNHVYSITDPTAIAARTPKLAVWSKHMAADRNIFQKYTAKRAGVANGWKKWQGEIKGLEMNHAVDKKREREKSFQAWANNATNPLYKSLLPQLEAATKSIDNILLQDLNIREDVLGIELVQHGSAAERLISCFKAGLTDSALRDTLSKVTDNMSWFYKNFDKATDKDVFNVLMPLYIKKCSNFLPDYYKKQYAKFGKDVKRWSKYVYDSSLLSSQEKLLAFCKKAKLSDSSRVIKDPAWNLYTTVATIRKQKLTPKLDSFRQNKKYLNRLYIKAQMERDAEKDFYPDANLTLRVTYGKIKGLDPDGPAPYSWYTTMDQMIKKEDTTKSWFKVPTYLKELQKKKDYGQWAVNDSVHLAFVAETHTTGGNSGSPVLNARGELIGTNFDRPFEGTMNDYYYDSNRCRNISLDIRYTLFIIEKFGGAGWLLGEMRIVR